MTWLVQDRYNTVSHHVESKLEERTLSFSFEPGVTFKSLITDSHSQRVMQSRPSTVRVMNTEETTGRDKTLI